MGIVVKLLLAIDPASSKTGLAFFDLETKELIETRLIQCDNQRAEIAARIDSVLSEEWATRQILDIACEEPFLQGRANTGMQRLLGMIEFIATNVATPVSFYHPSTVKATMGRGSLDKLEVALAAGELLKTEREKELVASLIEKELWDETDAIAVGLTYFIKRGQL